MMPLLNATRRPPAKSTKATKPTSSKPKVAEKPAAPPPSPKVDPQPNYLPKIVKKPVVKTKLVAETALAYPRWEAMTEAKRAFYIAKWKPSVFVDPMTRKWIRNAADERAAQEGYRFSEKCGSFPVGWISTNCLLYEGDKAGSFMDIEDWQYEFLMQVFGWQGWSDHWGRWTRRFREACVWIAKKNMKSPTLAATGLYLLCGDGELGQKCYSLARDKPQAMIAHKHAIEMVTQAQEAGTALGLECSYHKTTGTITHRPTRSEYKVVSGDNEKSTEGFNGNPLVDEVHVVDRKLMKRVKRAKISRSEPLHLEMSTAGDDPDGYGYFRFEQGLRHEACKSDLDYNPEFYFLNYSIPQTTKPEQVYEQQTAIQLGRLANPTMGRGIVESEFVNDWKGSVGDLTEFLDFLMYRMGLWLKSSGNWINPLDWENCGRDYTLQQLVKSGYPCVAGLDLSKTLDMTALVLMFAVPDPIIGVRPYIWPWFWIPESTARKYKNRVDFYRLAKNSPHHLKIVPGTTIDYRLVADKLDWCEKNLDFRGCGYDVYNSDTLMDILSEQYGWGDDLMIAIAQNMRMMAPPTIEVERLILRGEIAHNRNPVLEWQFRHCVPVEDNAGNKRPSKPTKDDYRKVDGIVALVMARAMYLEHKLDNEVSAESILMDPFHKRGRK